MKSEFRNGSKKNVINLATVYFYNLKVSNFKTSSFKITSVQAWTFFQASLEIFRHIPLHS